MLFPLVVGVLAVVLGGALALGPQAGARIVGPIRVLSVAAAIGVIALHLIPEAYEGIGMWTAVGFVAGLVVPRGGEWIAVTLARKRSEGSAQTASGGARPRHSHSTAALDIGYAGLAVHRFGDGLSMGAYARVPSAMSARVPVMLAFAAHIVPVTTVMVLAAHAAKGRRAAGFYATGLAVAVAAGVFAANAVLEASSHGVEPWISAVVGGLLLHVVVHSAGEGGSMFGAKKE